MDLGRKKKKQTTYDEIQKMPKIKLETQEFLFAQKRKPCKGSTSGLSLLCLGQSKHGILPFPEACAVEIGSYVAPAVDVTALLHLL